MADETDEMAGEGMTEKQMIAKIRAFVEERGSQKSAAERLLITPQYLCDILGYRREVSARVALAMGYDRKVVFVKVPKR